MNINKNILYIFLGTLTFILFLFIFIPSFISQPEIPINITMESCVNHNITKYLPCDTRYVSSAGLGVGVFGTTYEQYGNMTIYGWCLDSNGHPINSNGSIKIFNRANQTILNVNMTIDSNGRFRYNTKAPNQTGNYLVQFNCTAYNGLWGLDFDEIEIPLWVANLVNMSKLNNASNQQIIEFLDCDGVNDSDACLNVNTSNLINITNETNRNVKLIMDFWGIKYESYINITLYAPSSIRRGQMWIITAIVTDEYNHRLTDNDVWCNISTSFWGNASMYFNNGTKKFIYKHYLNKYGELIYNVTCNEY